MEIKMTGRELRNALLSIAQRIQDDDVKPMKEWVAEVDGFILGTGEGALAQMEVVKTVADMVEVEPKMLKALSAEIGNWSVFALARAIREYGREYGLILERTATGIKVNRLFGAKTAC